MTAHKRSRNPAFRTGSLTPVFLLVQVEIVARLVAGGLVADTVTSGPAATNQAPPDVGSEGYV
jgi:hypothetical protein